MTEHIKYSEHCSACGACAEICPKKAITLRADTEEYLKPMVDETLCVSCGACLRVCPIEKTERKPDVQRAFLAINTDEKLYDSSSSGGAFSALAKYVLSLNGSVFGAALTKENGLLICRHTEVRDLSDLRALQGSKYVHSQTEGIFGCVKERLLEGRTVLFSGTSCQVAALHTYLGEKYDNLLTVDLVCHGTPETTLLSSYVQYLEKQLDSDIEALTFRRKTAPGFYSSGESYVLALLCNDRISGKTFEKFIDKKSSAYFRMFLSQADYRPNCYACRYANPQKPADITLGDFKPSQAERERFGLDERKLYSSVFANTEKGMRYVSASPDLQIIGETDMELMLKHHIRLKEPSAMTKDGQRLLKTYRFGGFPAVQAYISAERIVKAGPRAIRDAIRKR